MPVNGVDNSGSERVEQVRNERRAEEARAAEQRRRTRTEEDTRETRRATESDRGQNMDVTA